MECFAPDKAQFHVIDHTAGAPMDQARKWVENNNGFLPIMIYENSKPVTATLELKLNSSVLQCTHRVGQNCKGCS